MAASQGRATGLPTVLLARAVSILLHPVVVMLVAAGVAAGAAEGRPTLLWQALGLTFATAAVVMGYSVWQARSGRWSHVDATQRQERSQLNRFASWLLIGSAGALALAGTDRGIVAAIGLSGAVVLAGHLLGSRLKASLHTAFAMFAALITWPHAVAFCALLLSVPVVAWSRLVLRRHGFAEVVVGAGIGALCGLVFQLLMRA